MTSTETKTTPAKAAAPAKKAPAKAAPAKKAPAKKAVPAKAAATTAPAKLRWQIGAEHASGKDQSATAGDRTYEIKKVGDAYRATVKTEGGKAEVLSDTTFGKAYNSVIAHNRARA